MKRWNLYYLFTLPLAATTLFILSGCNPSLSEKTADQNAPRVEGANAGFSSGEGSATNSGADNFGGEHGHIPGAHGGIMISLGRDSYHVEAVIDSAGDVRLYTLGKDESRVIDVESQTLKGFVKAEGDADSRPMSFEASPQDGDSPGRTSLFIGKLPEELIGSKLDVTIPNIRIDGERFRLGFVSGQDSHDESAEMPAKVANEEERALYLTPGGRYTAADIEANGSMTASQKFKGIKSEHDMRPKAGDMLCPISGTKANSKFTWIIDGKPYEFCCPPCIDEFLASAKESTDPLPDPESFIKK
jgi:YHS domain-containing protein